MATARDTIKGALRKIGRLAAGREPRPADAADALAALSGMYRAWINNGTFGRLRDVIPTGDYLASPNERVFRQNSDVLQITLPELVSGERTCDYGRDQTGYYGTVVTVATGSDGIVTVDVAPSQPIGFVKPPHDLAVVVIADAFAGTSFDFIYDGHQKRWQSIYDIGLDDEAPLSFRDPKGLEAALATQIVDEYGGDLGPMTQRMALTFQSSLTTRFSMPAQSIPGVYM